MNHVLHVSIDGDDAASGTETHPLRTVQRAADLAQPGTTVRVHGGVYRERVDPPRGGRSDAERIVFEAAPGEAVVLAGSEPARGWRRIDGRVWELRLPNARFGGFNPFAEELRGHWFIDCQRRHRAGSVFLRGHWMVEADSLEALHAPRPEGAELQWFSVVEGDQTVIRAEFPGIDPNEEPVEISARQCVFYPSRPGVNFITVRGFVLRQAATPWAPPTTEQIGLIGTNWSRGWVIEDNTVSYSACTGITLGKYHDPEDRGDLPPVEATADRDTYHDTIHRALANGWERGRVGGHVVRRNRIRHCEMAGICGSLGAIFSEITDNTIHDIHLRRRFAGWEMAGIKFHGAIDTLIARNHIHRCHRGLWLDWMSQGTRVHANLLHDNGPDSDLFLEVNHGPCVVDHNLLLSRWSVLDVSEGTLFAYNLIGGLVKQHPEPKRYTPHHEPHATRIRGFSATRGGDNRFLRNLLLPTATLDAYSGELPTSLFHGNATAMAADGFPARCHVEPSAAGPCLRHNLLAPVEAVDPMPDPGMTRVGGLPFETPEGRALEFATDLTGEPRSPRTHPGPFERFPAEGRPLPFRG
jgi:alpha-L-arabinofuranosidase